MLNDMDKFILDTYGLRVVYNEEIVELISGYYEMFENVIIPTYYNTGLKIPFPEICFVEKSEFGGFEFAHNDKYYIVIYTGTLIRQKAHLKDVFGRRNKKIEESYIDKLIKYTVLFVVMHEYMHIFCGHCLTENTEKIAQEIEADIEAVNFIIKKILSEYNVNKIEDELIASFVAIFYFFKSLEVSMEDERYNMRRMINYYEDMGRDHPLTSQRIMCIYKCYNVFLRKEGTAYYSLKDKIICKLLELGEKQTENKYLDNMYLLEEESIEKLESEVMQLRKKIPRVGKFE